MLRLTEGERRELTTGIQRGFDDLRFIGRFLDVFTQSVRFDALDPAEMFFGLLDAELGKLGDRDAGKRLRDPLFRERIAAQWRAAMQQDKLRGHTISNLAAVCIESHLQAGRYFTRGQGNNDLKRVRDGSRWELKGARSKHLKLTINQSHVGIDETTFLVYCGYPERNELHGIYVLDGRDEYFSPRKQGLNLRQLLPDHYDEAIQIYP